LPVFLLFCNPFGHPLPKPSKASGLAAADPAAREFIGKYSVPSLAFEAFLGPLSGRLNLLVGPVIWPFELELRPQLTKFSAILADQ
jgi:hypothetical protein